MAIAGGCTCSSTTAKPKTLLQTYRLSLCKDQDLRNWCSLLSGPPALPKVVTKKFLHEKKLCLCLDVESCLCRMCGGLHQVKSCLTAFVCLFFRLNGVSYISVNNCKKSSRLSSKSIKWVLCRSTQKSVEGKISSNYSKTYIFITVMVWCWKAGLQHCIEVTSPALFLNSGVLETFAVLHMLLARFLEAGICFWMLETPCGRGRSWISCPTNMAADTSIYSDCSSSLYLATLSSALLYEHPSGYQSRHQSHKELVLI